MGGVVHVVGDRVQARLISGTLTVPSCELTDLVVYFEGPAAGVDFYVDDVEVRRQAQ